MKIAENTHFSLQVWRFDKLSEKFEHCKELLVRSAKEKKKKKKPVMDCSSETTGTGQPGGLLSMGWHRVGHD